MNHENQMIDALLQLMARDIPDEQLGNALNDRARLMDGYDPDEFRDTRTD